MSRKPSLQFRRPKRVLTVRMLVARIAWLDGRLRWHEGRVVWEGPDGRTVPGAADLARAQRCLYKLRSYPYASASALGDSQAWLGERQARLELAKQLCALSAADLPALARQARQGNAQAVNHLVRLLIAEALCVNALPMAPSELLLACGERTMMPLRCLVEDGSIPRAGRALAALTLGAIGRAGVSTRGRPPIPEPQDPWLRRASAWGLRAGLPSEPGLIVALLADDTNAELAQRCVRALQPTNPFSLSAELLRELLSEGASPARIVELAEAAAAADPLAQRLLRRPSEPSASRPPHRPPPDELLPMRQRTVSDLADLLREYARATRDPAVVHPMVQLTQALLDLGPLTSDLSEGILQVLRSGLKLPAAPQRSYLELLVERQSTLWDRSTLPSGKKANRLAGWLGERWRHQVRPIQSLVLATGDVEIARQAVDMGRQRDLASYTWRDPDMYRWLLALSRDVCLPGDRSLFWTLGSTLERFPTADAARSLLQPLVRSVMAVPLWLRDHFLDSLLEEIPRTQKGLREALPRLEPYLPRLLKFAEADQGTNCICGATVSAALSLDRALPHEADRWLEWLLTFLADEARRAERTYEQVHALQIGIPLALSLAAGELARFQAVVRTAVRHPFTQDQEQIRRSLTYLERFPALRAPLAELFPQQPHRCAGLLVRLGLTTRLGADVLAPLEELAAAPAEEEGLPTGPAASAVGSSPWQALLALAPELAPTISAYRRAQALLGGSGELPPGVRRALSLPQKLTDELAYVERLLESQPVRADLAARAASLRARLSDEAGLLSAAREEIRKRLVQVTAEAQIAAAEQQVLACYRGRLETVAGPLPPDLLLDDNLLNATLLTVEITKNRRLLQRLLRAHLSGERQWREQHPANAQFLAELQARGVDTVAWLAGHPRRYHCPGALGDRVRLHLERDPLHILQMGNYFDTCLSVDDFNAFSTVTNACELNKRVVYAADAAGRVVGRKLIAVNADGGLVGFYTYTSLPDEAGNTTLRAIFRHYLGEFAARCGLSLAGEGRVPTLFAEAWYDDGTVSWADEEQPAVRPKSVHGHVSG